MPEQSSEVFALPSGISDAQQSHLEGVERQFHLSDDRLLDITRQFVDDFRLGLSEYNHAMAMMWVSTLAQFPLQNSSFASSPN